MTKEGELHFDPDIFSREENFRESVQRSTELITQAVSGRTLDLHEYVRVVGEAIYREFGGENLVAETIAVGLVAYVRHGVLASWTEMGLKLGIRRRINELEEEGR